MPSSQPQALDLIEQPLVLKKRKMGDPTSAMGNVARGDSGRDNSGSSTSEISRSVDEIDPSLDSSPLMQEKSN